MLAAGWLVVHLVIYFHSGIRQDLYDARGYIESAHYFLHHGGFQVPYQIFYSVPILLIAMFEGLFNDGVIAFVVFQCLLSGMATLALYHASSRLFNNTTAGLCSAIIFLFWWDAIQWNTAVMTESVALSVTCLIIGALARFRPRFRACAVLTALIVLSMLIRPTGVLMLAGGAAFLLTICFQTGRRKSFLMLAVVASVMMLVLGWVMLSYWDFTEQYEKGNLVTYMDHLEGQPLYSEDMRLSTAGLELPDAGWPPLARMAYFVVHNPLHFLQAGMLKIALLLSGFRPYFSTIHNVYAIVWLCIVYLLYYVGFRRARMAPLRNFTAAVIVANCLLVGISTVDWDNRFYLPMQPGMALVAGGGAAFLLDRLSAFAKKGAG